MVKNIDFNTDIAQGFGIYKNNFETEMLNYVSTASISCGAHAGDPPAIREALLNCKEKNVAIGAHIGFFDLQGCGYRPMELESEEIEALVIYQLGALASFAKTYSLNVEFVRPHGAMYKLAYENFEFSCAIANAIKKFDKWLTYYGASGENLEKVSEETGIVVAREIFIDKNYTQEGLIDWENTTPVPQDVSLNRIRTILHSSQIKLPSGGFLPVKCDTIHFDCKDATKVELAKRANEIISPTPSNFNKVEASGWV